MSKQRQNQGGYYYIENRDPLQDPNVDLNFNNDILYSGLLGDDVDASDVPIRVFDVEPSKSTKKHNIKKDTDRQRHNYNICLYFILIVIGLLFVWYLYSGKKNEGKNIIDSYANDPDLIMLSPDMGMESRFGRI